MRRTQIYITDEQEQRLRAIASARGISKAEAIREILDRTLNAGDAETEARAVIAATAGICGDYPDWPEWLSGVRGRSADQRLRDAGL